jgi:hypothetical protein
LLGALVASSVALIGGPGLAHANGAFPDSLQILLPTNHPHRIVLATNFGLVISDDDGATWEWTCEPIANDNTILYQQAAAPSDRIFAVMINHGLVYSDDEACTWTASAGTLATAVARDAFADPTNPQRVFAVAAVPSPANGFVPSSVYLSDDGGLTFGAALDTAPSGGDMLGVESAVSDPTSVYLAMYGTMGAVPGLIEPLLGRSTDGGGHWTSTSLATALGPASFRIIAVDPSNPQHLFLRVTEQQDEKLAVSTNGGSTFTEPISVKDQFSAFARLKSGTILVSGSSDSIPVAYRSTDGGATFQSFPASPPPPHLRALAERDGKLYAAGDNIRDKFAIAVSTDEGVTFQPLLTFDQVKRVKPCVQELCRDVCENLAGLTLWPDQVCGVDPDAGTDGGGGAKPSSGDGCACDAGGWGSAGVGMSGVGLWALWLLAARRRGQGQRRAASAAGKTRPAG